jgi:hypothetical protein
MPSSNNLCKYEKIKKWKPLFDILFYLVFLFYNGLIFYNSPNWTGAFVIFCGITSFIIFLQLLENDEIYQEGILVTIGKITLSLMAFIYWGIYFFIPILLFIRVMDMLGSWAWIGVLLVPILEFILMLPPLLFCLFIKNKI